MKPACQGNNNEYMALPSRKPQRTINRRFALVAVAGVSGALMATGGCSTSFSDQPPCFPPAYSVSPATAQPGQIVTVTAPEAVCNPRYGANARIQVIVTDKSGVEVINATAPMTDAGGFTYTFRVPAQVAVGEAAVTAMPYNID